MTVRATQSNDSFQQIVDRIYSHLEERDWLGNKPRGLAISLALEANELLEHYQWQDEPIGDKAALAEELADVLIYAFEFAMFYDIDMPAAIKDKLAKAAKKYPASDFKNVTPEVLRANWLKAKLNHKKEGL